MLRSLWERQTWRKDSAAALIFARLLPLSKEKSQPSARLERLPPEHFRCFVIEQQMADIFAVVCRLQSGLHIPLLTSATSCWLAALPCASQSYACQHAILHCQRPATQGERHANDTTVIIYVTVGNGRQSAAVSQALASSHSCVTPSGCCGLSDIVC